MLLAHIHSHWALHEHDARASRIDRTRETNCVHIQSKTHFHRARVIFPLVHFAFYFNVLFLFAFDRSAVVSARRKSFRSFCGWLFDDVAADAMAMHWY